MTNGLPPGNGPAGPASGEPPGGQGNYLGMVVDGSLGDGVEVRLAEGTSVEDVKVGTFITIQGSQLRFFGVVTEIALGSTDPRLKQMPPDVADPFISQVVQGTVAYGKLSVLPNLIMPVALGDSVEGPVAAKTIPPHFSPAYAASARDVAMVFGEEDERHFWIGNPLDMEAKVCLDLDELVKRSIGVFGKSGTGKTFLTRLLLIGLLQKSGAVNLVFDMHNEYGWEGTSEGPSVRELDLLRRVLDPKRLFLGRSAA